MAKDEIDLYDDKGNVLAKGVPLQNISPLKNAAIKRIVSLTVRTGATDLAGLQKKFATGEIAGKGMAIRGVARDLPIVDKANEIAKAVEDMLRVEPGDDTKVELIAGGKRMLTEVPTARILSDYSVGLTAAMGALTHAIIDVCKVSMWDAPYVHAGVWGMYPQNPDPGDGGAVKMLVDIPMKNEGPGFVLRNIPVNHLAATVRKRAMQGAALTMILEEAGQFEMGNCMGPHERGHLLDLAYEGLNANNMVHDLIKENGKTGTLADVIHTMVERAKADGVIKPLKKLSSGFTVYDADDMQMWNAYACAGMLAAVCVNTASMRAGQPVPSNIMYSCVLTEQETGLPGPDFGMCQGTSVSSSFFSHSIYGGGGPGVFYGNHIVTRHAKGQFIPCFCAAMCIDADTMYFTPSRTSGLYGEVLGAIPEFAEPMKAVAEAAKK
ncbi:MAG: coenzyme-B sulfoethylthiotransferase subunit beta [Halobacteriota archaeon]